ncbi:hypothetical protein SUGI_0684940 [Cryptomeria japonica]|nr:hypothetical protein SUGI_0684940 [Cryptomeria japonica]
MPPSPLREELGRSVEDIGGLLDGHSDYMEGFEYVGAPTHVIWKDDVAIKNYGGLHDNNEEDLQILKDILWRNDFDEEEYKLMLDILLNACRNTRWCEVIEKEEEIQNGDPFLSLHKSFLLSQYAKNSPFIEDTVMVSPYPSSSVGKDLACMLQNDEGLDCGGKDVCLAGLGPTISPLYEVFEEPLDVVPPPMVFASKPLVIVLAPTSNVSEVLLERKKVIDISDSLLDESMV